MDTQKRIVQYYSNVIDSLNNTSIKKTYHLVNSGSNVKILEFLWIGPNDISSKLPVVGLFC